MSHDSVLNMLGLARRAGKLALGDELVREACNDKKARCVLVAADAGVSTAKKAAFYAERANVPLITLPHDKDSLGAAIGKNGCAICAVTDIGLAAAAVRGLAAQDAHYAVVSAQLDEKNERIQSRKGKKKTKDKQKDGQQADKPQHKQDDRARSFSGQRRRDDDRPRSFSGQRRRDDDKSRSFWGQRRRDDNKPRSFSGQRRRDDDRPRSFSGQRRRDDNKPRSFWGQRRRDDDKPRSFSGQRRRDDDKPRSFSGQQHRPNENPHAKRAFNRKPPRRMTER